MPQYRTVPHLVTTQRIDAVLPLVIGGGRMLAPDAGVILRLDDGAKIKWLAEENTPTPQVGDFFVNDAELATTFVVPAKKFETLFEVV